MYPSTNYIGVELIAYIILLILLKKISLGMKYPFKLSMVQETVKETCRRQLKLYNH